jgi:hypothetical protein
VIEKSRFLKSVLTSDMADRSDMQNTKSQSEKPVNGQGIQDPIEPGSNDIDERTSK